MIPMAEIWLLDETGWKRVFTGTLYQAEYTVLEHYIYDIVDVKELMV